MSKILISLTVMAALTGVAHAQTPAPPAPDATPAPSDAAKPASGDGHSGVGDTANQQTYKMKDGGMYQPPAQRPASPAMETKTYGRT